MSELYTILMALVYFPEPLNIVVDTQYAKRVVLQTETAEFMQDYIELTLLSIQLQEVIINRNQPYI